MDEEKRFFIESKIGPLLEDDTPKSMALLKLQARRKANNAKKRIERDKLFSALATTTDPEERKSIKTRLWSNYNCRPAKNLTAWIMEG